MFSEGLINSLVADEVVNGEMDRLPKDKKAHYEALKALDSIMDYSDEDGYDPNAVGRHLDELRDFPVLAGVVLDPEIPSFVKVQAFGVLEGDIRSNNFPWAERAFVELKKIASFDGKYQKEAQSLVQNNLHLAENTDEKVKNASAAMFRGLDVDKIA